MLFTDLPLCDSILEGLRAMNFKKATPVQERAIPVILDKKDVIACAQTGTGKTAAFLLPLLDNLQNDNHDESKVNAIIMAPTRELAQQIDQMMEGFSYYTPFSSVAVYGGNDGEAWDVQKRGLLSGADVVIATPGRLLSHINIYNIDFSGVKYFILDEADRMLDMGFYDDIMKIENLLPKDRQTIMFSATMPPKIQQLAKTILRDPIEITIAIARPPETILQSAYICYESQKTDIVKHLFKEKKPNKVLLFAGSKMKVKEITRILRRMGLEADEMHSDLDQSQREHVMHEFRNERVNILVATDIVARGIDIDDISLVINYDVPYDAEDYVHRIGRTARAGDSGMAITFVSPDEQYRFSLIEKFLEKEIYRIPIPSELGDAPEYNPVRDKRRRGAAVRSKGSRRKGKGRSAERTRTPEGKEGTRKTERTRKRERTEMALGTERTRRREGTEEVEKGERGEQQQAEKRTRTEKATRSDSSKSSTRERSERGEGTGRGKQLKKKQQEVTESSERIGNRQGVERTGRGERNERKEDADRHRKSRKQGQTGQRKKEVTQPRAEKSDSKKQKRPRQERPRQESQTWEQSRQEQPRQERQKRQRPKQERSKQEPQVQEQPREKRPRRERAGQERPKQERPKQDRPKQDRRRQERSIQGQPQGRKRDERPREHEYSKAPSKPKSTTGKQTPHERDEKTRTMETKKSKKWSWWPFGKK